MGLIIIEIGIFKRIKISVITDISVLEFYGYIGNIDKISVAIFVIPQHGTSMLEKDVTKL